MSINPNPSAAHDLNPSTAASEKIPVDLEVERRDSIDSYSSSILGSELGDDDDDYYAVKPRTAKRRASLPPLPDLRFEQSYLRSIEKADTYGKIAFITVRDQVGWKSAGASRRKLTATCRSYYLYFREHSGRLLSMDGAIGTELPSSQDNLWVLVFDAGGGE